MSNKKKPILRWAGGKWRLTKYLLNYLPDDFSDRKYREPFLGAGSMFFAISPQNSFISDANKHLIDYYLYLRDNPDLIYKYLMKHSSNASENYYYKIRNIYNKSNPSVAQAARFIFLNRTCFNGIFRVNTKGNFNVPYGRKEPPPLPSKLQLKEASDKLYKAKIEAISFEKALESVSNNDFIYLDPPYPPLNGTSFFTHYTKDRFLEDDQKRLAELVSNLNKNGCKFMMTNADTILIRKLYKNLNIYKLSVTRWITSKSKKHNVSELVITNYNSFKKFKGK